ncbi:MAG: hypothetical protein H7281_06665 [Bacteriovorax sp.]|nr:hypothetical protein [Bacteriovorax sp.]
MQKKQIAIFVPGYYGTTLQDEKSGKLIWGDTKEVLFGRKTLALPIDGIFVPGASQLKPHSLINDKKILGGLIREDAYDKTISHLKRIGIQSIYPLAWDWRRDPYKGIIALNELVIKCKRLHPDSSLILVSHSFGSLITSYYLRFGVQDFDNAIENWEGLNHFDKIILSATPFRGLMAMFRNMHYGIKFGLNQNMQTPLAFSSFESSYYLLPPPGLDLVQDENGKLHSLELHNPMVWKKNRYGLFHENCGLTIENEIENEARMKFIDFHITRARQFHQLLDAPIGLKPKILKPILYLSGHGQKTVHHGVWLKKKELENIFLYYPKHFKKWKIKIDPNNVYGDGDSTIPDFSLELPSFLKELNTTEIRQKKTHLNVLQSIESQSYITDFLLFSHVARNDSL